MANHCHRDRRSLSIRPGKRSRFATNDPSPELIGTEARMHATAKNPERSNSSRTVRSFMRELRNATERPCKPGRDGNASGPSPRVGKPREKESSRKPRRCDRIVESEMRLRICRAIVRGFPPSAGRDLLEGSFRKRAGSFPSDYGGKRDNFVLQNARRFRIVIVLCKIAHDSGPPGVPQQGCPDSRHLCATNAAFASGSSRLMSAIRCSLEG